jgi:hypothetical protein
MKRTEGLLHQLTTEEDETLFTPEEREEKIRKLKSLVNDTVNEKLQERSSLSSILDLCVYVTFFGILYYMVYYYYELDRIWS